MSTNERSSSGHNLLLLFIAFFGIFVYGLVTALPGAVLPELERHQFLPDDANVATFLFINAVGAVIAYLVSGPLTDRLGKKFTLWVASGLVIGSMAGLALIVAGLPAATAVTLIFGCSLILGLGANAIVSAGHALVGDVAGSKINAALNLLDVCFGLGLVVLPLLAQKVLRDSGLNMVFWVLAIFTGLLLVLIIVPRFPRPVHPESFPVREAGELFRSGSFWLLAIALFMYVGTEVSVAKWVVTFIEKDPRLISAVGIDASRLRPDVVVDFFKNDSAGIALNDFALKTLSFFGLALMIGRLISSYLLGVLRVSGLVLLVAGSTVTAIGLAIAFNAADPGTVRWAIVMSGIGMGPIFPTSVGLASVIAPRIAGTAMSWVMGIGFAGLLVIPPSVGYISDPKNWLWRLVRDFIDKLGGVAGNVRKGLFAVLAASVIMLLFHIILAVRERRRGIQQPAALETEAAGAK
jgi:fucose permease